MALKSEWIHFEAGALSKTVEKTYVCPLLIAGLEKEDVPYPLAQFQLKKADKDGMFDIVKTINSILDKTFLLSDEILKKTFDRWWPDFEKVIDELPVLATDKTKRTQEEMLEEILNSVRALSNMISEQGWSTSFISPRLENLIRAYRSHAPGAGIGTRSTGLLGLGPSEAVRLAIELMSPSASPSPPPSEEPADDQKKTE